MQRVLCVALALGVVAGCGESSRKGRETGPPAQTPPTSSPEFNADSAWVFLARQVEFGPRVPGTEPHRLCGDWLAATLERFGAEVEQQPFVHRDAEGREWPLHNIVGRFGPAGGDRLLLVAHWDTRPWADEETDPELRERPIPGANDGASGVAVLLEVARGLGQVSLSRGVDILLADGEDLGRPGRNAGYCQGSRRFARRDLSSYEKAVVFDLVAGRNVILPVEANSLRHAPLVVDWVWERGLELSPEVFSFRVGPAVYDDHMPLNEAGLPTADVIDMAYPAWHTLADDLDAVSKQSLAAVGRVALSLALRP
jgi:glutaminyl-peptide cyclotransferase